MPHWYQPGPQATAEEPTGEAATAKAATAQADPAAAEAADSLAPTDSPTAAGGPAAGTGALRRPLVLLILGAVTVLLGGFGIWATVHASSLRTQAAQQNTALIDPAATTAVQHQIDSAVQTIFSYSYASTAATRQAAQRLLTGPAIQQYDSLFALVQREAPAEKLVVTTTVTNSGVELLTGGLAGATVRSG